MRLLLGTHAFLWFISNDTQLSQPARESIENPAHENISQRGQPLGNRDQIKLGKIEVAASVWRSFPPATRGERFWTAVDFLRAVKSTRFTSISHRDPFDRLLIAQAIADDMIIVTRDPEFLKYSAKALW